MGRLIIDGVVDAENYFASMTLHLWYKIGPNNNQQLYGAKIFLTRIKHCKRSFIAVSMQGRPDVVSMHHHLKPFRKNLLGFMILLNLVHFPSSTTPVHMV